MVSLTAADGHILGAYRAGPEDARSGIVVVQEIFGVNSHIRDVCDRFAAQGYAVIAPALFDRARKDAQLGYAPDDIQAGLALRAGTTDALALDDIAAAAAALGERSLAIIGYCWGGTLAWLAATRTTRYAAAIGWYGGGIEAARHESPNCPVQLHFGETDNAIPATGIAAIRAAQPGVEVFTYPGAGHGFGCDQRGAYTPAAYALAQQRTLALLRTRLAPA